MNLSSLISLVFPPICVSCGQATKTEKHICPSCLGRIKINSTLFCGACRARLPEGKKICHYGSPFLLGAATDYEKEIKAAIHGFKFKYVRAIGDILGNVIVRYADNIPSLRERREGEDCLVVPMPISPRRRRERGFNQSEKLAEILSAAWEIPCTTSALLRIRHTKAQSETKGIEERRQNIFGCFAVNDPKEFEGKIVFLIDDVLTSGATAEEAAKELRKAGAKEIIVLVAAKA